MLCGIWLVDVGSYSLVFDATVSCLCIVLRRFSWYHSSITGVQAENLLKNEGKHGSFLFRPSSEGNNKYCLTVR